MLENFLWLRKLYANFAFKIELNKAFYGNEVLERVLIKGSAKHRFLEVENFLVKSKKNDFNIKFSTDLETEIPFMKASLKAKKIDAKPVFFLPG